jgi:uncharacterized cupin superfamily protein
VRRVNIRRPELDHSSERDGYRWQAAKIGRQLGSERVGATLYVLGEGEKSYPYHFHHVMEEWAIVLEGAPTLRSPAGERGLRRGDVFCFPAGPDGGHQLRGPGTVLLISTRPTHDTAEYPDSAKLGSSPPGKLFRLADAVDYWEGE